MGFSLRYLILSIAATVLSACGTTSDFSLGSSENFAVGSRYAPALSGRDRAALETAFLKAMETGAAQKWSGRKASGVVTPGVYAIGNLSFDQTVRTPAARGDLDLSRALETELGDFVLTRNSNVRLGPGTDHPIAETLPSGSGVAVIGKIAGGDWMLISADGVVRGYVYEALMIKAPGAELELAGGPVRQARLCREYAQSLRVEFDQDAWAGAACQDPANGRWRLINPAPGQEGGPALLLLD